MGMKGVSKNRDPITRQVLQRKSDKFIVRESSMHLCYITYVDSLQARTRRTDVQEELHTPKTL